jgi:hypothetical protein
MRARLAELGFEPGTARTPDEMTAGLRADYERVGRLLREIDFKPQ